MKPVIVSLRNCVLIKKIYKEKLYYNRNRMQNTFCRIIYEILNEQKSIDKNESNCKNKTK